MLNSFALSTHSLNIHSPRLLIYSSLHTYRSLSVHIVLSFSLHVYKAFPSIVGNMQYIISSYVTGHTLIMI